MDSQREKRLLVYSPRMGAIGGIETHLALLSTCFARQGWRVSLMTTTNSLNQAAREQCLSAGVKMVELALPIQRSRVSYRVLWLMWMALRNRMTHWDVIYTNAQGTLAKMVWWSAGKGTRIVHHHHTAADTVEQQTWSRGFVRVLKRAPELVACSRKTKANLEMALGRRDVRVMPYFTAPLFSSLPEPRYIPSNQALKFGYIGRLVSTKGIDLICRLSKDERLSGIQWHLYGDGPDYPASFFTSYLNVHYHGRYASAFEYSRILEGLDAVVLFSNHPEGMPLSLIEAMSAGLPWIATDKGGTAELMVSPDNCRLLSPNLSGEDAAQAVMDLAHAIRAGQISRQAQIQAYANHFSPGAVEKNWLEFFQPWRGSY